MSPRGLRTTVQSGGLQPQPDRVVAGDNAIPSTIALVAWPPAVRPNLQICQAAGVGVEVAAGASFDVAQCFRARNPVVGQADRTPRHVSFFLDNCTLSLERRVEAAFRRATLAVGAVRAYPIWRRNPPF